MRWAQASTHNGGRGPQMREMPHKRCVEGPPKFGGPQRKRENLPRDIMAPRYPGAKEGESPPKVSCEENPSRGPNMGERPKMPRERGDVERRTAGGRLRNQRWGEGL